MCCPGQRANTPEPPTPAAMAVVALVLIVAVCVMHFVTGCAHEPRPSATYPAWTNAAPYQGARGPSW